MHIMRDSHTVRENLKKFIEYIEQQNELYKKNNTIKSIILITHLKIVSLHLNGLNYFEASFSGFHNL